MIIFWQKYFFFNSHSTIFQKILSIWNFCRNFPYFWDDTCPAIAGNVPAAWRGGGFQHIFNASQRRQKYTNSCPARYADIAPNCSVVGSCMPTVTFVKILTDRSVPFSLHDTFFKIPTNRTAPAVVSRYIFQKNGTIFSLNYGRNCQNTSGIPFIFRYIFL